MPSEVILQGGERISITASITDIRDAIAAGRAIDTQRFAGFQGADAKGAEAIFIAPGAVAAAIDIAAP